MIALVARVEDPYGRKARASGPPLAVGLFVEAEIEGISVQDAVCASASRCPRTQALGSLASAPGRRRPRGAWRCGTCQTRSWHRHPGPEPAWRRCRAPTCRSARRRRISRHSAGFWVSVWACVSRRRAESTCARSNRRNRCSALKASVPRVRIRLSPPCSPRWRRLCAFSAGRR